MAVSDDARASLLLADYANTDAVKKVNILGAGWQVTGLTPMGLTAPQALVVLVEVPQQHFEEEFAVSVTLRDEAGEVVKLTGQLGAVEALRIQQIVKAERPNMPGVIIQAKLWSRVQVIFNFAHGLPLAAGKSYMWELEIDGHHDPQWSAGFLVGGPPEPVVG